MRPRVSTISAGTAILALSLTVGGSTLAGAAETELAFPATSTTLPATANSGLSDQGERAIDYLRECVASNSTLDVFYLVDASGSLFNQPGQAGTDPDNVRSSLIANSLSELAGLSDHLKVNYSLGFFGTTYKLQIPWRSVSSDKISTESTEIESAIKKQGSLGWTNWQAAVYGAQNELSSQHKLTDGCQLLVWLTDGGINLNGNNDSIDNSALNDLCGAKVRPGSSPEHGYGVFNELRQSGVVVVGVLLNVPNRSGDDRDATYMPYMRPLVEGVGDVLGEKVTCGEYPIPEGYAFGALVEASSSSALARVFVDLGAKVSGGYAAPFGADGSFPVDPGISSFSIVTTSTKWQISSPDGEVISNTQSGDAKVVTTSGVTRVDVETRAEAAQSWIWRSDTPDSDGIFYFSDLRIELNEPKTFLAGAQSTLSGKITRLAKRTQVVADYQYRLSIDAVSPSGRESIPAPAISLDSDSGEFTFEYTSTQASGSVTFEAKLDNLATVPSGIALATITSKRTFAMTLPTQYPTISPLPLEMSELAGSNGKSAGKWIISGPADGSTGQVCFPEGAIPKVTSDSAKRLNTWKWNISPEKPCIEISGETVEVSLTASNSVAANSKVKAFIPVEYVSAGGDKILGSLAIEMNTTRPINVAAFGVLALLLLVLGTLGPLALMILISWWTHKITIGSQIQRASFPVMMAPDGVLLDSQGAPLSKTNFSTEQFRFMGTQPDSRSFRDNELGVLRALISLNPFGRPWFEIRPEPNRSIISSAPGHLPLRREKESRVAKLASFNGDLGSVWALVVTDENFDLVPDSNYLLSSGTLVVYLRNTANDSATMQERMGKILAGTEISDRLSRARQARVALRKSKPGKPTRSKGVDQVKAPTPSPGGGSAANTADSPPPSISRTQADRSADPPSMRGSGTSRSTNLQEPPTGSDQFFQGKAGNPPRVNQSQSGRSGQNPSSGSNEPREGDPPASPWRSS